MSIDPPTDPKDERKALDYRTPEDRFAQRNRAVGAVTAGILVAAAIVGFAGFVLFVPIALNHPYPPTAPPQRHWAPVVSFVCVAGAAFALAIYMLRTRRGSRWFLTGFLMGIAIAGLLEGICFLPPR